MPTLQTIKLIIIGAIALAVFSAGGAVGWKLQASKVEKAKAEKQLALQQLKECQTVNQAYASDMSALKAERDELNDTCQKRLESKDALVKKMRAIDALSPVKTKGAKDAKDSSGDPLLGALNRVFPKANSQN